MAKKAAEAFAIAERRIEEERRARTGNLILADLGLSHLPGSLWQLTHIKRLHLNDNELIEISDSIENLTRLQFLGIAQNRLAFLPSSIEKCGDLRHLYLDYNQLTDIPHEIGNLKHLITLGLCSNKLVLLPDSHPPFESRAAEMAHRRGAAARGLPRAGQGGRRQLCGPVAA